VSSKLKNGNEIFLPLLPLMVLGYPCKTSQNHGKIYARKIFMIIVEFITQFFFQRQKLDYYFLGSVIFKNDEYSTKYKLCGFLAHDIICVISNFNSHWICVKNVTLKYFEIFAFATNSNS
jgi:hypothetical protein